MPGNINLEDAQQNKIIETEIDIGQVMKELKKTTRTVVLELHRCTLTLELHWCGLVVSRRIPSPLHSGTERVARRKKTK